MVFTSRRSVCINPSVSSLRHDPWNSVADVLWRIHAMFSDFIPAPGIIIMRPAACATSFDNISAPARAVGAPPDVNTRSTPILISVSKAASKSGTWSNARWNVTCSPWEWASSVMAFVHSVSIVPSVFREPITTRVRPAGRLFQCGRTLPTFLPGNKRNYPVGGVSTP